MKVNELAAWLAAFEDQEAVVEVVVIMNENHGIFDLFELDEELHITHDASGRKLLLGALE